MILRSCVFRSMVVWVMMTGTTDDSEQNLTSRTDGELEKRSRQDVAKRQQACYTNRGMAMSPYYREARRAVSQYILDFLARAICGGGGAPSKFHRQWRVLAS